MDHPGNGGPETVYHGEGQEAEMDHGYGRDGNYCCLTFRRDDADFVKEQEMMIMNHVPVNELPYCEPVKKWLIDRYGKDADRIWEKTVQNYNTYLKDLPDYGGKKNGHARAIYGGLLVFALYPALPDEPPIGEMQEFVNNLFMGPFTKLGKIFNLNRSFDMWLIDKVFRKSGNRDRKDIRQYPAGFVNVDEPYDREHHAARYHFTQCPNAEFAKSHNLLHVLPLMCNSDFFGIGEIHGQLIRCGTCGNSDKCDYLIVGSKNEMAAEYETVTDEQGFLVSRRIGQKNCFDQKEIDKYVRGSERSKKREYPMDWVFDFSYDLSVPEYYVTHRECGVCKIGQQEGLMFLTPHMCVMDYPTIEYKGGKLLRTKTLGAGGDCCDFHVVKGDK